MSIRKGRFYLTIVRHCFIFSFFFLSVYHWHHRMHNSSCNCLAILGIVSLVWYGVLSPAESTPLDLGFGGVYNSPEANAYWERRFGTNFFGSLRPNNDNAAQNTKTGLNTISEIKDNTIIQED